MNVKSTIVLLILAGGCAALFWKGPDLAPRLGLAPKPIETTDRGTTQALANLRADEITRVLIHRNDKTMLALQAPAPRKPLELLGSWPVRRAEVDELLNTLRDLKSRYYPIPIDDNTDLKPYGLDDSQKPLTVEIARGDNIEVLRFGETRAKPGDNPFTLPAYVRMGETTQKEHELALIEKREARIRYKNEIIRLGPHVLPILNRSEEVYRRRQIFPEAIRERVTEGKRPPRFPGMDEPPTGAPFSFIVNDDVKRIAVDAPSGHFVLERVAPMPKPVTPPKSEDKPKIDRPGDRANEHDDEPAIPFAKLADSWILVEPVRDRIDPEKLRSILTIIPGIWVEKFAEFPDFVYGLGDYPDSCTQMLTVFGAGVGQSPLNIAAGIVAFPDVKSATAKLTLTMADDTKRTLQLSRLTRASGGDEFRYAQIENNRFVFEIKSDKLSDLQVNFNKPAAGTTTSPADDLRDPTLVRFEAAEVIIVEIATPGEKAANVLKLRKDGFDWKMEQPLPDVADRLEIEALLSLIKGWDAKKGDILDGAVHIPIVENFGVAPIEPKGHFGLLPNQAKKVTLTFDPKTGKAPATFLIGKPGGTKRAVMAEGWNRVNLVSDGGDAQKASKLDSLPSQYRLVKLTEPGITTIKEIVVERPKAGKEAGDSYTLQADPDKLDQWLITAPIKAETDRDLALGFADALRNLSNLHYVYDSKTDGPLTADARWPKITIGVGPFSTEQDLASDAFYGFDAPVTITLKFSKPEKTAAVVFEIGRQRSNGDYLARVKGTTGIFAIPDTIGVNANRKAEELADKTLINIPGQDPNIQTFRRTMGGQEMEFSAKTATDWEMLKPFPAKAEPSVVGDLVRQLAKLKGTRIAEFAAKDLKKYGLDPAVATITLEVIERGKLVEKALLVGNPVNVKEPNGERFVKAQGSTTVAVIPGPLAKSLTAAPSTFRDRSIGDGFVSADKIVIERGARKITFAKGPGGWKVSEPLQTDADDQGLRDLHDLLAAKPKAEEIVEDKPKDLAKYGLDKPEHLRFFNGDKEVLHLLIGSPETIGPDKKLPGLRAYAMIDKADTVYLIDSRLTHMLKDEYRKRELWPAPRPEQIMAIAIKAADPKDSFTFTKGPMGLVDLAKKDEPLQQVLVSDLMFALAEPQVEKFVVDKGPADLKLYGLDKPRTATIILMGDKKYTLLLGTLLDGKKFYAKIDDLNRTEVFLLSEVDSRALNRPRSEYTVKKEDPKKEPEPKKKDEPKKEEPKKETDPKKS